MNYIVELHCPLDIFDAATYRCLPGFASGFIEFTREELTFGSVIYHLRQEQLGDMGSIELHKIHAEVTAVHVNAPPTPSDDESIRYVVQTRLAGKAELFEKTCNLIDAGTPAWLLALIVYELIPPEKAATRGEANTLMWHLALPREDSLPLIIKTYDLLADARKVLQDKRKDHHRSVLQAFNNRLHNDGFMTIHQRLLSLPPKNITKVRQLLVDTFSDSELRNLCFDIEIDYESLPGQGKADKARELLAHVKRHKQEDKLLAECRKLRPHVDWLSQSS